MRIDKLETLTIHKLSKEQYLRELKAGNIDMSAFYLTPHEPCDIVLVKNITESATYEEAASAKAVYEFVKNTGGSDTLKNIMIGTTNLEPNEGTVIIPVATEELSGVVKSSTATNDIAVREDGTMEVNEINVNKIVQDSGDTLFLSSGNSEL